MSEHFDVLIVGAGLSGIGAAYRVSTGCPGKTWAVLESRERMGGTWDLFRYPGIRSDSDMFTLGYQFRPWKDPKSIADGPAIRTYIEETAAEFGIDKRVRFGQKVTAAAWDSSTARWTVETNCGQGPSYTCNFLYMCSGYYRYEAGYEPPFPGRERFTGTIVHPQKWPEDLDYSGKKVVIIGSGATAVTLLPSMASSAARVTMLQRSPSYVLSLPGTDPLAELANKKLPARWSHRLNRFRAIVMTQIFYQFCRRWPAAAKKVLAKATASQLPSGYEVDPHFKPSYNPWDQRMCVVPDGDLFRAIKDGRADVVTDHVKTFTETGIELQSGRHLEADIIVTATGLQVVAAAGIPATVDGVRVRPADCYAYRGCMLSGMPNFAFCIGYTNASWTLRADLSHQYVCRVLNYMDRHNFEIATPVAPADLAPAPLMSLSSGYIQRAVDELPKAGNRLPWKVRQNYILDFWDSKFCDVTTDMSFGCAGNVAAAGERREAVPA